MCQTALTGIRWASRSNRCPDDSPPDKQLKFTFKTRFHTEAQRKLENTNNRRLLYCCKRFGLKINTVFGNS